MLWTFLTVKSDISGGTEGLAFTRPPIELGVATTPMDSDLSMFVLTFLVAVTLIVLAVRITESPFGQILKAVREIEERTPFLGYDTYRYKIASFVLAGSYAGAGGTLYAMYAQFAFLCLAFWKMSGELLMMVLIGSIGTLFGPVGGVYVYIVLRNVLSSAISSWQIFLGGIFVLIVLFNPDGLVDIYERGRDRVLGGDDAEAN